jgi:hypothetical protein
LGTFVLIVVGLPATLVGLLVLALDGVAWPLLGGCAVLAAAGACGAIAYRRRRAAVKLRRTPRRRNRVFLSYRTAEHATYAERVARVLTEAGVGVFFAGSGGLKVSEDDPSAAFRQLGLFQMADLDADLQAELAECDAVVYFVPTTERRLRLRQVLKDSADALGAALLFESGRSRAFWRSVEYTGVYGRGFAPAVRLFDLQGWQDWELSMARQLGLVTVKLQLGEDTAGDADPNDEELVIIQRETLERDVADRILPLLREAARPELEPSGLFPVIGAAALGVFGTIAVVLLTFVSVTAYLLARAAF